MNCRWRQFVIWLIRTWESSRRPSKTSFPRPSCISLSIRYIFRAFFFKSILIFKRSFPVHQYFELFLMSTCNIFLWVVWKFIECLRIFLKPWIYLNCVTFALQGEFYNSIFRSVNSCAKNCWLTFTSAAIRYANRLRSQVLFPLIFRILWWKNLSWRRRSEKTCCECTTPSKRPFPSSAKWICPAWPAMGLRLLCLQVTTGMLLLFFFWEILDSFDHLPLFRPMPNGPSPVPRPAPAPPGGRPAPMPPRPGPGM